MSNDSADTDTRFSVLHSLTPLHIIAPDSPHNTVMTFLLLCALFALTSAVRTTFAFLVLVFRLSVMDRSAAHQQQDDIQQRRAQRQSRLASVDGGQAQILKSGNYSDAFLKYAAQTRATSLPSPSEDGQKPTSLASFIGGDRSITGPVLNKVRPDERFKGLEVDTAPVATFLSRNPNLLPQNNRVALPGMARPNSARSLPSPNLQEREDQERLSPVALPGMTKSPIQTSPVEKLHEEKNFEEDTKEISSDLGNLNRQQHDDTLETPTLTSAEPSKAPQKATSLPTSSNAPATTLTRLQGSNLVKQRLQWGEEMNQRAATSTTSSPVTTPVKHRSTNSISNRWSPQPQQTSTFSSSQPITGETSIPRSPRHVSPPQISPAEDKKQISTTPKSKTIQVPALPQRPSYAPPKGAFAPRNGNLAGVGLSCFLKSETRSTNQRSTDSKLQVHKDIGQTVIVYEVDQATEKVCTAFSYVLHTRQAIIVWHGIYSNSKQRTSAEQAATSHMQSNSSNTLQIEEETASRQGLFWAALNYDPDQEYARSILWARNRQVLTPPQFFIVRAQRTSLVVEETSSLPENDISIVITSIEAYVVVPAKLRSDREAIEAVLHAAHTVPRKSVHVLVFPTIVPVDFAAACLSTSAFESMNNSQKPERMNIRPLSEAMVELEATTIDRKDVQDRLCLPLGLSPESLSQFDR